MPFLDMIIQTDVEGLIEDVTYLGDRIEWFDSIEWAPYIQLSLPGVDLSASKDGIVECAGVLFKYQVIMKSDGKRHLFFSQDGVMMTLFRETLEKVTEGVQIYDKNGYFVYSNQASERLGDYKKEDFVGRHLLDIYDLSEEISTTLSVLRTNKPVLNRCDIFKKRSGKELVTINSGYPLEIDSQLLGAVSFEGDLTLINNMKNKSFSLEAFILNEQPVIERKGFCFEDIVHTSSSMKELVRFAKKIALTDTNILITGETGTGKELFAQSIHNYSPRRDQPFIDINCGAIPSNLVESVFFGTEKGAFTGSVAKKGLLELADGGTLFLDEVNSMGLEMQAKLLRALQENRFQRIGGQKYIECNIRIITASNEDLRVLSSENKFRKDLYYRLSTLSLNVPPLRERKSDIQLLLNYFIKDLSEKYGKRKLEYTRHFRKLLEVHEWPGNVRELQHAVEFAIHHLADGAYLLSEKDLPDYLHEGTYVEFKEDTETMSLVVNEGETLVEMLQSVEKNIINQALADYHGNITKAAQSLGLSRQSLQHRMKKF